MFTHLTYIEKHFRERVVYCIVKLKALISGRGMFEWDVELWQAYDIRNLFGLLKSPWDSLNDKYRS